jgi:regulator of sigma E protease
MTNNYLAILLLSTGWIKFIQFFIALSILIILHEWGHYYAARRTGTRVEKFYLFFDFLFPVSTWLPFSLFKKKIGDTEYGLGWFPMGGYVKIAGMIDESMDKEAMAKPPEPWEFRSKTAPQRLLIMLGGIIMNVLLAIVVYIIIFAKWGEDKLPYQNLKYGIGCDSLGYQAGFMDGDVPMALNGKEVPYYEEFKKKFIFDDINKPKKVTVIRNGAKVDIDIPEGTISKMVNDKENIFGARIPMIFDTLGEITNLKKTDFVKGDVIIGLDNTPIQYYDQFNKTVNAFTYLTKDQEKIVEKDSSAFKKKMDEKTWVITALRNNKDTIRVSAKLCANGKFGIGPKLQLDSFLTYEHITYNPLTAIPRALSATWKNVTDYKDNLKAMFTSKEIKASKSVGGFGSFASIFPETFEMESFLRLLAFISVMLAFMNLLPIPGLDGGYVMFLLYEMIAGKKPNENFVEKATSVGLMLLLGLMLYANGLDILRWLKLV